MNSRICMQSNYFVGFIAISVAVIAWSLYQVSHQSQQIQQLTLNQNYLSKLHDMEIKYQKNNLNTHGKVKGYIEKQITDHPMIIDHQMNDKEEQNYDRPVNESTIKTNQQVTENLDLLQQPHHIKQNTFMVDNYSQREIDYQRLSNPFVPPLQRGPMSTVLVEKNVPINSPSHGEYGHFQQVGYVYKLNNPDQMFNLFGRRIHSGKYEYYAVHPITQIKIPIKVKNDFELNKDDTVIIKGFPGDFQVEIYDLDQPRYIPY